MDAGGTGASGATASETDLAQSEFSKISEGIGDSSERF